MMSSRRRFFMWVLVLFFFTGGVVLLDNAGSPFHTKEEMMPPVYIQANGSFMIRCGAVEVGPIPTEQHPEGVNLMEAQGVTYVRALAPQVVEIYYKGGKVGEAIIAPSNRGLEVSVKGGCVAFPMP